MKANLQLVLYSEGAAERARMQNQMPKAWTILTSERKREMERCREGGDKDEEGDTFGEIPYDELDLGLSHYQHQWMMMVSKGLSLT